MESDTGLLWLTTFLPLCWAALFTPRSFTKTRDTSTKEKEVLHRVRSMQFLPRLSRAAMMDSGNRIIRGC